MDETGSAELRARADDYRRLRQNTEDARAVEALTDLANECEAKADAAEEGVQRSSRLTRSGGTIEPVG